MSFFEYYYNNILRYEFLNKYFYKNIYQLPELEKIVLSFTFSQTSLKSLLPLLSALTLLSSQNPYFITSKCVNVSLKVRSGLPIGCKVDLRGKQKFLFLEKLIFSILPHLKEFSIHFHKKIVFLSVSNLFVFKEIEKDYEHFPDLPNLNVNFVFKTDNRKEIIDYLTAFWFPLQKAKKFS